MPNLNRVFLMGNLTRDPEMRYLPSNRAVVGFGIAVNRKWRTPEGEQREETTFVDCSAFGRTAEVINQYLKKGRPIFVDGRLRLEQWQDRESGANRSKLSVVVDTFQFIDSRGGEPAGDSEPQGAYDRASAQREAPPPPQAAQSQAPEPQAPQPQGAQVREAHEPIEEGDIPF